MVYYNAFNRLGAAVLILYNLLHVRARLALPGGRLRLWGEKRFPGRTWIPVALVLLEALLVSAFQYLPAVLLNKPIGNLLRTGANYFVTLFTAPLSLGLCFRMMKVDPLTHMDLVAPAYPLALIFAKLGCFGVGCCHGIPWAWGIPNATSGIREVPMQLVEAAVAAGLFLFLHLRRRKMQPGTLFPVYLTAYSGIRFLTEFLRYENNLFLCFKRYHFFCLIGVVAGILQYRHVQTHGEEIRRKYRPKTAQ